MDKKEMYDAKYSRVSLRAPAHFPQQFEYIRRWAGFRSRSSVIDVGGGTGEYSIALQRLGYDVTLNDISDVAIDRAKENGVRKVIPGNIFENPPPHRFEVALVKGFSPLNTGEAGEFLSVIDRISTLADWIVVWGVSNNTGSWTQSGWFNWPARSLRKMVGDTVVFPALRYQYRLPHALNRSIGSLAERAPSKRPMTVISVRQP